MEPDELKARLTILGIRPSKSRGQCFLVDEKVARMQVRFADVKDDETVLEVGPGLGVLTELLDEKAKHVVGIEQDKRLYEHLRGKDLKHTELINEDALKVPFPKFDKIVSNLPYQISSPITFKFLDHEFSSAVLMYQKEFAQRMVAEKGRISSRLSVKLHYKADARTLGTVPRTSFYPVPDVDGAIVMLEPRAPPFKLLDEKLFFKVVDCIYSHRRKKIGNCFVEKWRWFGSSRQQVKEMVKGLPFRDRRAEELEPEEMAELANSLKENII